MNLKEIKRSQCTEISVVLSSRSGYRWSPIQNQTVLISPPLPQETSNPHRHHHRLRRSLSLSLIRSQLIYPENPELGTNLHPLAPIPFQNPKPTLPRLMYPIRGPPDPTHFPLPPPLYLSKSAAGRSFKTARFLPPIRSRPFPPVTSRSPRRSRKFDEQISILIV